MKKKILALFLVLTMLCSLVTTAVAAGTDDFMLNFSLEALPEDNPTIVKNSDYNITAPAGTVITIKYCITNTNTSKKANIDTSQDEILYDHNFFDYVAGSAKIMEGAYEEAFSAAHNIDSEGGGNAHLVKFNNSSYSTGIKKSTTAQIGEFKLKIKNTSTGTSVIQNTNIYATLIDTEAGTISYYPYTAQDLTVNVGGGDPTPTHTHSFTYGVSGNVVTATCGTAGCGLPDSKIALTLTANNAGYTGSPYAGASTDNAATGFAATTGATVGEIEYWTTGDNAEKLDSAPTVVGSYIAKVTVTGGGQSYTAQTAFTISEADPTYTAPAAKTLTYTGSAQELLTAGSTDHGTITYCATEDGVYSITIPKQTNADTYTVYYKVTGDVNHKDVGATAVNVTIAPKSIAGNDITITAIGDQKYTSSEIKPTVEVKDTTRNVTLSSATDFDVAYSNNTAVGTATVTITGKGNYDDQTTKTANFKIVKGDSSVTWKEGELKTTFGTDLDMTDKYTVTGSTGNVTFTYYTNEACTTGATTTQPTDAGTYWVKASVAADGNYAAATSSAKQFTVEKAEYNNPVSATYEVYYKNGEPTTLAIADFTGMPDDCGDVNGFSDLEKTGDSDGIIASVDAVNNQFTVNTNDISKVGKTAALSVKISTRNYKDITATVTVKLVNKTDLSDKFNVPDSFISGKIYDGQAIATNGNVSVTGYTGELNYTFYKGSTALPSEPKDAGDYMLVISIPDTNETYMGSKSVNFTISPKELTITGLTGGTKTYDGTNTAKVNGTAKLSGVVSGESVTLNSDAAEFTFEDANVGTDKPIAVTGYALSGDAAVLANYTLTQPTGLTGKIEAKEVRITATISSKTYDGKTTATASGVDLDGVLSADTAVVLNGVPTFVFADKNAGTGKSVTVSNLNALSLTGDKSDNYTLVQSTGLTGNITAKSVTITGLTVADKDYDGTKNATVTGTAVIDGKVDGDNLTVVPGKAEFADANAGSGKDVTFTGYSLGGTDKNNYTLSAQPAGVKANIKSVISSMTPGTVKKGSESAVTLTITEAGFTSTPTGVKIDNVPLNPADFTITKNGSTYTIVIKGGVIAGLDKGNHVITVIGDDNVEVSKTLTVKTNSGGHGGSGTDPKVESVKTGDAGIALYGVLALSSVLGMGWIGRKKHDAE